MFVIVTREIDIGRVRGAAGTDRAPYATGPGWSLIAHRWTFWNVQSSNKSSNKSVVGPVVGYATVCEYVSVAHLISLIHGTMYLLCFDQVQELREQQKRHQEWDFASARGKWCGFVDSNQVIRILCIRLIGLLHNVIESPYLSDWQWLAWFFSEYVLFFWIDWKSQGQFW